MGKPVQYIPKSPTLQNFVKAWVNAGFSRYFGNSLFISISSVAVNIVFNIPFNAILMKGFMAGIPFELEEAAMIDGCSRFEGVIKVVLPVLIPGIVTVSAFAFIGCWNEFLFSLMFLNDPSKYTVPIGLKMMQGEYSVLYGSMAAGALIAMAIPVALFAYLQKYLVTGMTSGGVKG